MLIDELTSQMQQATKSGESSRRDTLRFLIAAVQNSAIAKYGKDAQSKLTDSDVMEVIKKQVKTHRESIEAFEKAKRKELANKEKTELAILETYLPKELSDEELKKMLAPVMAAGETNFGLLMKNAMAIVKGRADGGRVATLLKHMVEKR